MDQMIYTGFTLNCKGKIGLQGQSVFERMLNYFEQMPMRETRECKNFISFLMELIFFENFEKFS